MLRKDSVDDLRNDRVLVADDAGKQRLSLPELFDDIATQFFLDGEDLITGKPKLAESGGSIHGLFVLFDDRGRHKEPTAKTQQHRKANEFHRAFTLPFHPAAPP